MSKETIYKPSNKILDHANIKESEFDKLYKESIENPEGFWSSQAELYLDWDKKWNEVKKTDLKKGEVSWFFGRKVKCFL